MIEVHLLKDLVEAIGVKSCWLLVTAKPDFVEPSGLQHLENDASSRFTFAQGFDAPDITGSCTPCMQSSRSPNR